jgi:type VI secretion system secreted protein VgrG
MAHETLTARLESGDFSCEYIQIHRVDGREAISRLFSFEIGLICVEPGHLSPDDIAGANASLVFEQDGEVVRTIYGMIAEVEDLIDTEPRTSSFRIVLVPHAHRLTMVETQEVFLNLSVPDIVTQKLERVRLGGPDVEMHLSSKYEVREMVIEYKESDLAFISRLTEHLGISFFFTHEDGRDKLVFADSADGFVEVPGHPSVTFDPGSDKRSVYAIHYTTRISPKRFIQQDYNYRTPRVPIAGSHVAENGLAGGVVEYGAHAKTPAASKAIAQVRAEEREATHRYYSGESALVAFTAGSRFKLEDHPKMPDQSFLLVEVEHHFTQPVMLHGAGEGPPIYKNTFRATPAQKTYRPPRVTPKPRISGIVTAIVEPRPDGALGKYADIDQDGRYTVLFMFDTAPRNKRFKSSRAIRMIQPHAGPNYGMHFPLHPGVEVAIVFVDGDPDRPLIHGAIPNPETSTPVQRQNSVESRVQTASGLQIIMKDT